MELIPISQDVLVNPQRISVVEMRRDVEGNPSIVVVIDGRTYNLNRPPQEFLTQLNKCGVDLSKQFFAV